MTETKLKRVGRYLAGAHRLIINYPWQPWPDVADIYKDANHQGCPITRKSTTCVVMTLGQHYLGHAVKTQALVSVASAESEFYAGVKAVIEALYLKHFTESWKMPLKVKVFGDNSAARVALKRSGPGPRMKHLQANSLFVQQYIKDGTVLLGCVTTEENVADIGAKHLGHERLMKCLALLNCVIAARAEKDFDEVV